MESFNTPRRYHYYAQLPNGRRTPAKMLARRFLRLPLSAFHTYYAIDVLKARGYKVIYIA